MTTQTDQNKRETKGEEVKRLVEERIPPSERGSYSVMIRKDSKNLTRVTIRGTLEERSDGGDGSSS